MTSKKDKDGANTNAPKDETSEQQLQDAKDAAKEAEADTQVAKAEAEAARQELEELRAKVAEQSANNADMVEASGVVAVTSANPNAYNVDKLIKGYKSGKYLTRFPLPHPTEDRMFKAATPFKVSKDDLANDQFIRLQIVSGVFFPKK